MIRTRITAVAAAVGVAGLLVALGAAPAAAHERRTAGRYRLVVGFGTEPAYAGERNSVQVRISDAKGRPVTNLGEGLQVEVTQAGAPASQDTSPAGAAGQRSLGAAIAQGLVKALTSKAGADPAGRPKLTLTLQPNFKVGEFGEPGDYRAWFVPTAPGAYAFRIVGTIGRQRVDQRFASSPTTFDGVADRTDAEPPVKEPTGSRLASRTNREVPRLSVPLAASQQRAARAESVAGQRAARADGVAGQARLIATLGVAVGVLGLVTLSITVARSRRQ